VSVWGSIKALREAKERWRLDLPLLRFFLCFPYLNWSTRTTLRVLNELRLLGQEVRLGLDSGGFVQRVKLPRHRTSPTLIDYEAFLREWVSEFEFITAWDYAQDWRQTLTAFHWLANKGHPVTPVWHLGEPFDLLRLYAAETPTGWVAIGGFGQLREANARAKPLFIALKQAIDHVKDEFPDVQFHALGVGFNTTLMSIWQPDSADSTTPLISLRYGWLIAIKEGDLVRLRLKDVTPDLLPDGINLNDFHHLPPIRTIVTAYWALKVCANLNRE